MPGAGCPRVYDRLVGSPVQIPFNASDRASLGVEVELQLVDRGSRELVSAASPILADLGTPPKVKHELFECTLEVITGICATADEATRDLAATIADVRGAAAGHNVALLCAGSHPFSDWNDQTLSPDPRYSRLLDEMQWVAQQMQIFGVHFHVGVRSAEKSIAIANALTVYLPYFLALSASSPFWGGRDTGLASSRSVVFERLPTAGLPYDLADWGEFEQFMETLVAAQAISTIREVWWDIRPHPDFGTVELRMCDGIPTLWEVGALAALAQSLVHRLDDDLDTGRPLPVRREWIVRQNKWRAARYGLDAEIIVDERGARLPLRAAAGRLVADLAPVATELGCEDELDRVLQIVGSGASYERQRGVVAGGGGLADVVDALVAELATGCPGGT